MGSSVLVFGFLLCMLTNGPYGTCAVMAAEMA